MKAQIELNFVSDGRVFLNYWDWRAGNDLCCEVINGELALNDEENDLPPMKITLQEFIDGVKNRL